MESHYFHLILQYLRAHPHSGELFTFLVAFSESLPLIGTVIPGTVTMTLVGILIGTGVLPAVTSLLIASIAAFLGDSIGYITGYYYNERIRTVWPFRKHPKWLKMGEAFFKKHGGKSIVLGRFIGPARSTVPLVAGLLKLSWLRFMVAAIPSAALWALMYMVPGILLGALSREMPKAETTRFLLYGIGTLAVIWLIFWLIQHFFIQLARGINHLTDRYWHYLTRKNTGRFLIRLIQNQQKPDDHHQLTFLLGGILSGILFLTLLFNVMHHGILTDINYPIFHLLQTLRTVFWNKIFVFITLMGAPKTILIISILMTLGLMIKKQWRTALHFIMGFILTAGAAVFFKLISHSQRPQGFNFVASSYSFPSGHTALSFVIFTLMAFFAAQIISKSYRWIPYTLSTTLIILVSVSRLYLGAHWFTDIIGSLLLGLCVLFFCIISYRRMPSAKSALTLSPFSAALLFTLSLAISWAISIPRAYEINLLNTTPLWSTKDLTINAWWQSPLDFTPLYRNNRLGNPFQPFNVQWQGSLEEITATLKNQGWEVVSAHPKLKLKTTLQRFASHEAQYHMPLLPWLYRDKPPVVFLIKRIPSHERIIELRLWESDVHFQQGSNPLWIGATDIRIPPKILLSLKEHTTISLGKSGGLNELYTDTANFKRQLVKVSLKNQPQKIQTLNWDGHVLLIRENR